MSVWIVHNNFTRMLHVCTQWASRFNHACFSLVMRKIDKINVFGKFEICYFVCSCLIIILDELDSCCRQPWQLCDVWQFLYHPILSTFELHTRHSMYPILNVHSYCPLRWKNIYIWGKHCEYCQVIHYSYFNAWRMHVKGYSTHFVCVCVCYHEKKLPQLSIMTE